MCYKEGSTVCLVLFCFFSLPAPPLFSPLALFYSILLRPSSQCPLLSLTAFLCIQTLLFPRSLCLSLSLSFFWFISTYLPNDLVSQTSCSNQSYPTPQGIACLYLMNVYYACAFEKMMMCIMYVRMCEEKKRGGS